MNTQEKLNTCLPSDSRKKVLDCSPQSIAAFGRRVLGSRKCTVAIIALTMLVGANQVAHSQNIRKNIEAGHTEPTPVGKQVESYRISIANPAIASAKFDGDNINITGLMPGSTTVTFDGREPAFDVNRRPISRPFRIVVLVIVLQAQDRNRATAQNYEISAGGKRRTEIEYLLGPAFQKLNAEGVDWCCVNAQSNDDRIATVALTAARNTMVVEIVGRSRGRTTVTLTGQQRIGNTFQNVTKGFEVVVTGGNQNNGLGQNNNGGGVANNAAGGNNNPNPPPRDPTAYIDAVKRRYADLKNQSERIGSDADKQRVIKDLDDFINYLDQEIKKDYATPNSGYEKAEAFAPLLADLRQLLKRLKANPDDNGSISGDWRAIENGKDRGLYHIEEANGHVTLKAPDGSTAFEGTRLGNIVRGKFNIPALHFQFSGELRAEPGLKELKVWSKGITQANGRYEEVGELQIQGRTYVRQDR